MNNKIRCLILFCLLWLVSGCAGNQALYETPLHDVGVLSESSRAKMEIEEISHDQISNVKPGQRPPLSSDEAGLWMVMDQAEEKLKTSGHLILDADLSAYLKDVTCRLVPEYCDDIRIYLVHAPYFNASMMPNGAMQIWTGMLLRVHNEAQLASIIGHEVGHYLRRHSLQQMRDVVDKTNALVFVRLTAALAGVPAAGDVAALLTLGSIQAYSRDFEREADGYGVALMSRAGYDPREAATVWRHLLDESMTQDDRDNPPIFLSTHPASEERYEAIKRLGEKVVAKGGVYGLGQERFNLTVLPHRVEYLRDELHLRDFSKSEKLFDMLLEKSKQKGELFYYKGELFRIRGKEGDSARALAEYEHAMQSGAVIPEMFRAMGLIYQKQGERQNAVKALNRYLELSPDCTDAKMVKFMIEEMGHEK